MTQRWVVMTQRWVVMTQQWVGDDAVVGDDAGGRRGGG